MKSKTPSSKYKDDIFWQALDAAISLDVKKGHLKWSITELARVSKISRTLIYYYFGKSKEDILLEAVSLFGRELAGETEARSEAWRLGKIGETLGSSQVLLSKSPAIRAFYFLRRNENTKVGEAMRDFEVKFRVKISKFFPTLKKAEREGLYAVFLGLALTPDVTAEAAQEVVNLLMAGIKKKPTP